MRAQIDFLFFVRSDNVFLEGAAFGLKVQNLVCFFGHPLSLSHPQTPSPQPCRVRELESSESFAITRDDDDVLLRTLSIGHA
jgi:hypothetical protein